MSHARHHPPSQPRHAIAGARRLARLAAWALAPALASACDGVPAARADAAPARAALAAAPDARDVDPVLLASIRRGRAIVTATRDSLPGHVGNALRCTSCHLDGGTRPGALPWTGVYARFPQYRAREGRVLRLEDRVNACLQRSLAGRALPEGSPAMRDVVAYLAWLSYGVAVGPPPSAPRPAESGAGALGDTVRGRAVYAAACARCHGAEGDGSSAPPLWGPRSFTIGAGMARLRTAQRFIAANMPHDRPGTLDPRAALDVAAFVTSRPRPDFAGKEHDWPRGGAPADAAYLTRAAGRR